MNVRKMMARLNATTCRFDVGSGGIPELTNIDIAGALGMVSDEFAREVFCAVWWPDGARLTEQALLAMVGRKQAHQINAQWRALQLARLDLHIAEDAFACKTSHTSKDHDDLGRMRLKADKARRACWPAQPQMYPKIRLTAMRELRAPNLCPGCEGRGELVYSTPQRQCPTCAGRGTLPVSSRQRAEWLGCDESNYRRAWRVAYEWTYDQLADAEVKAAQSLRGALARIEEIAEPAA